MSKHKPQFTIQRTEEFVQKCNELSKVYGRMVDLINAIDWGIRKKTSPIYPSNYRLLFIKNRPAVKSKFPPIEDHV